MKKSIQQTFYRSIVILFGIFILCSIIVNAFLSYNNFYEQKESIKEDIINSKKMLMKEQIDFISSNIMLTREKLKQKIKEDIKTRVQTAYNIAQNLYQTYKNDPNIQSIIIESLRELKFYDIGDQYVFMTKLDGTFLLVPGLKELEGKNVFDLFNENNQKAIGSIIDMVKKDKKGYFEYSWQDHKSLLFMKKISYFIYFEPFDCYIGTGVFFKDIELKVKESFINDMDSYRFGENMQNYLFSATYEGISLTHPAKGKNVYNVTDANGLKVVQELIKTAKKGSGYVKYTMPVGEDKTLEKISYVKGVDAWNLYIGTGETIKDIDKIIEDKKEELLKNFYIDMGITLTLGFLSLIIFYLMLNRFKNSIEDDLNRLIKSISKLVNENKQIDIDTIQFKEFSTISENANNMLETKLKIHDELKEKEMMLHQQSKMAAMGDMLENIAHQWRQPLSVITVAATGIQLKKQFDKLDDKYLNKTLGVIVENSKYLSTTIDDFRNFFLHNKNIDTFKIDEALDLALNLVSSKFKNRDIELIKRVESIKLHGYKNELIQVILIILNNSKDALEDMDTEKYIFIDIFKKDGFAHILFKDNAKGIKQDNIQKIFEPYFTTKHKSQGTGIGLYMAREIIVKHMNGTIEVENEHFIYNKIKYTGAKFYLKIPIEL